MPRAAPATAATKAPTAMHTPKPARKPSTSFARTLAKLSLGTLGVPKPLPPLHAPSADAPAATPHPVTPRHHHEREGEPREPEPNDERPGERDLGDPTWAHRAALMAPPLGTTQVASQQHVDTCVRQASVEQLAPQLLRKLAWSGDGKRGTARLELGAGSLSGAVVTLEADGREVALSVEGLTASEESSLRSRLSEGLSARGFRLVG